MPEGFHQRILGHKPVVEVVQVPHVPVATMLEVYHFPECLEQQHFPHRMGLSLVGLSMVKRNGRPKAVSATERV